MGSQTSIPVSQMAWIGHCHGALYRTWWCDPHGGIQGQSAKSINYFKVFKARKKLILDCSIQDEYIAHIKQMAILKDVMKDCQIEKL